MTVFIDYVFATWLVKEEFKDTKRVIGIRKPKDR